MCATKTRVARRIALLQLSPQHVVLQQLLLVVLNAPKTELTVMTTYHVQLILVGGQN